MTTGTSTPRLAAKSAESSAGELRKLRAENESLRCEVRRASAVADGIELGLRAMTKRLVEAEAKNSELQRRREVQAAVSQRRRLA